MSEGRRQEIRLQVDHGNGGQPQAQNQEIITIAAKIITKKHFSKRIVLAQLIL